MSLRKIFILAVLFSGLLCAQNYSEQVESDSTQIKINFNLFNSYGSALHSNPGEMDIFVPDYSVFFNVNNTTPLNTELKIRLSKIEFYNALEQIPQFREKNDLGVFGQILTYTNTAATLYLLYKHIDKYGLK